MESLYCIHNICANSNEELLLLFRILSFQPRTYNAQEEKEPCYYAFSRRYQARANVSTREERRWKQQYIFRAKGQRRRKTPSLDHGRVLSFCPPSLAKWRLDFSDRTRTGIS